MVPPGEVTAARSCSGWSSPIASSAPRPRSVWSTRMRGLVPRAARPSTPASIIASASRNTYAGPEPERPVTASRCCLGHAHHDADRAEHALGERRGRRRSRACRRRSPTTPGAHERGRVGHRPDDRRPGARPRASAMVTPAAIDRTMASLGAARARALSSAAAHVVRLHRDHHDVGVGRPPRPGWAPRGRRRRPSRGRGGGRRRPRRRRASRRPSRRRAGRRRAPRPCARRRAAPPASCGGGVPASRDAKSRTTCRERRERARGTPTAAHFPERTRPRHLGPASIRARRVRTAGLGDDTLSHSSGAINLFGHHRRSGQRAGRNAIRTTGWNQRSVSS